EQIIAERRRLASSFSDGEAMSDVLAAYEQVVAEQEFAELAFRAAQTALEKARIEALRQHRYLVTPVPPRLAEEALYPRRLRSTATVFVCALVAWGIGVLAVAAVKDHAGWV
ncbi:MAG TPA: hypothetical protein VES39_11675, partial [Rhodospirillales bacterium]|nr:hypothetical protein [Rhodospirillales bacterium]